MARRPQDQGESESGGNTRAAHANPGLSSTGKKGGRSRAEDAPHPVWGIADRGGALASLNGSGDDEDVGYSTLGLRAATVMQLANATIVPKIFAARQHAFDDVTPDASLAFATTGMGFGITGVPLAQDSLLVEAGLDLALSPTATARAFLGFTCRLNLTFTVSIWSRPYEKTPIKEGA
ncbi:MAG: autotransporter outer membrane beta-barrel domain-containing protein [Methyloceanibacter sp.]